MLLDEMEQKGSECVCVYVAAKEKDAPDLNSSLLTFFPVS